MPEDTRAYVFEKLFNDRWDPTTGTLSNPVVLVSEVLETIEDWNAAHPTEDPKKFVHEQHAIEHAAQMADRWNRIYMRTLRNLRDLRRYAPVTINNPQQVNIAAEGGQQVNVKSDK